MGSVGSKEYRNKILTSPSASPFVASLSSLNFSIAETNGSSLNIPSVNLPSLDRNKLKISWSHIDFSNFDAGNDIKSIVGQFFNSKHLVHSRLTIKVIDVLLFSEFENVKIDSEREYSDSVERAWQEAQLISDKSKRLKERDYTAEGSLWWAYI